MVINHNMSAMYSNRQLGVTNLSLQKDMEKLSSGMKINRAGDDASGLAVSEKMRSQIRGLNQASRNASNGISFIQTTEGYLQETTDIMQRIRELAVQASNGIYSDEDRMQIQVEVSQLVAEVDRIASSAQFNGMNMLTGRFAMPTGENSVTGSMWFHIGANMDQRMGVYIGTMTASALGIRNVGDETILSLAAPDDANRAIGTIDEALKKINKQRADLGGYQNRLDYAVKGIDIAAENLQAETESIRTIRGEFNSFCTMGTVMRTEIDDNAVFLIRKKLHLAYTGIITSGTLVQKSKDVITVSRFFPQVRIVDQNSFGFRPEQAAAPGDADMRCINPFQVSSGRNAMHFRTKQKEIPLRPDGKFHLKSRIAGMPAEE